MTLETQPANNSVNSKPGKGRREGLNPSPANTSSFRLYQLNAAMTEITDMLSLAVDENGEITETDLLDKLTARLDQLQLAKEVKAENVAIYIKSLQGEAELIARERERLERRESAIQKKIRWLKDYAVSCLQADPSKPGLIVNGVRSSISWRRSDAITVAATDRLPVRFKKYSVTEISEDEILLFGDTLKHLKGLSVEAKKDLLKKHMKSRMAQGRKFHRVASVQERYTIQIK